VGRQTAIDSTVLNIPEKLIDGRGLWTSPLCGILPFLIIFIINPYLIWDSMMTFRDVNITHAVLAHVGDSIIYF